MVRKDAQAHKTQSVTIRREMNGTGAGLAVEGVAMSFAASIVTVLLHALRLHFSKNKSSDLNGAWRA
jgi:hypothetical protein